MSDDGESGEGSVGYGRPPISSRFRKGHSGNPRGRPRNRRRGIPYDHVLGQMVTIRDDRGERRVTAAEAFLLQLTKKGLQGDSAAARASLAAIEEARAKRHSDVQQIDCIVQKLVSPGSVGCSLDALGMAAKLRKYSDAPKYQLKPWLVELAVARLGSLRLSVTEQQKVVEATATPPKVRWPEWWTVRG